MDIWKIDKWKTYYANKNYRSGIKIDYDNGVNEEVRCAISCLIDWLRKNYNFPIRVRIYVKKSSLVKARDGDLVPYLFFWPYNREDEPYIKLATGDFYKLKKKRGRDDALATILTALLRNFTHYFRWLNNIQLTPIGEERQATKYARLKLNEYKETREHS